MTRILAAVLLLLLANCTNAALERPDRPAANTPEGACVPVADADPQVQIDYGIIPSTDVSFGKYARYYASWQAAMNRCLRQRGLMAPGGVEPLARGYY